MTEVSSGPQNTIIVDPKNPMEVHNWSKVLWSNSEAYEFNGSLDHAAAHEAGHLMWVKDFYDQNGPCPGFEDSIMGRRGGEVGEGERALAVLGVFYGRPATATGD